MGKYQIIESRQNVRGDKLEVRVELSRDESVFLSFPSEPSEERIDAEIDMLLKRREVERLRSEIEELGQVE